MVDVFTKQNTPAPNLECPVCWGVVMFLPFRDEALAAPLRQNTSDEADESSELLERLSDIFAWWET